MGVGAEAEEEWGRRMRCYAAVVAVIAAVLSNRREHILKRAKPHRSNSQAKPGEGLTPKSVQPGDKP